MNYLKDLQQKHLASDANSHQFERLQLELQQVEVRKQYRASQHVLYDQTL